MKMYPYFHISNLLLFILFYNLLLLMIIHIYMYVCVCSFGFFLNKWSNFQFFLNQRFLFIFVYTLILENVYS